MMKRRDTVPSASNLEGFGAGVDPGVQANRGDDVPEEHAAEVAQVIRLGDLAQDFLNSDVGKAFTDRVADDVSKYIDITLKADDLTEKEVRDAHFKARVADQALTYLKEFINEGRSVRSEIAGGADNG